VLARAAGLYRISARDPRTEIRTPASVIRDFHGRRLARCWDQRRARDDRPFRRQMARVTRACLQPESTRGLLRRILLIQIARPRWAFTRASQLAVHIAGSVQRHRSAVQPVGDL
jgi:hypothetical protein